MLIDCPKTICDFVIYFVIWSIAKTTIDTINIRTIIFYDLFLQLTHIVAIRIASQRT